MKANEIRKSLAEWFTGTKTEQSQPTIANSRQGKILVIDIETGPMVAYCWGLWKQNINYKHIATEGRTLCFAYRWVHDPEIPTKGIWINGPEEIKIAHALFEEADAIVTYNGTKFDIPVLNSEFLLAGLSPPAPYINIDLYQVAKRTFRFPSNAMDYVAKRLGHDGKVSHRGMEMWTDCMAGDPVAMEEMLHYNKIDVDVLMNIFYDVRPWIKKRIIPLTTGHVCPKCGSENLRKKGTQRGYQRYQCVSCGAWTRENKMLPDVSGRGVIRMQPLNNS